MINVLTDVLRVVGLVALGGALVLGIVAGAVELARRHDRANGLR